MNKLKQLQEQLRALVSEGDALHAKDKLTDEETQRFSAITTEMDTLEADIETEKRKAGFTERRSRVSRIEGQPLETGEESITEDRTDYNRWPVEEAWQWFAAVRSFHVKRELPSRMHPELRSTMSSAISEQRAIDGQNTLVDDEGGFLIPSTISSTVLTKMFTDGQLISRCQPVPITVGRGTKWNAVSEHDRSQVGVKGGRFGGIRVYDAGEGDDTELSKAHFEQVALELQKRTAGVPFTEEQLEDGPQAMTIIDDLLPRAFVYHNEAQIFEGNGGSQMQGFMNTPAKITVSKETGQAAATVVFENIQKMWNRMPADLRAGAVWFINLDVEPQLESMYLAVGTAGVPVYLPLNGISQSGFATLKGRPVIPIEHCNALGTEGDIVLANMSQYLYGFKGGLRTTQSIHVRFLAGDTILRAVMRNCGKSWWPKVLTPAKGTTTRSPFITLQTRS